MAESFPLTGRSSGLSTASDEHGRGLRLGQATGPRELARFLGAPSVVVTERDAPPPTAER